MEKETWPWIFLVTFVIILSGALCRFGVIRSGVRHLFFLPYRAALIMLGIVFGFITFTAPVLNDFGLLLEQVDRLPGLTMFLPAFIFKTVFLMDWNDFRKCWLQVLILGSAGFIMNVLVSGVFYAMVIGAPLDSIERILVFGSIISVIDAGENFEGIAQVGKLRTTLEGEALLSTAIATFILTQSSTFGDYEKSSSERIIMNPFFMIFINITLGVILGKIFMMFLKQGKGDFNTYVCISLAAGYLLFFAMEMFLSYGVVSLIVFSIMVCPVRRGPDSEKDVALTHFWTNIHLLANILVCVFAGMLFSRSFIHIDPAKAFGNTFALYFFVLCSRFIIILLLSPIIRSFGVFGGFTWRTFIVLIWAGIRGSISLGLIFCQNDKIYRWETCGVGMILLNQIINGSTLRALLIGLGKISFSSVSSLDTVLQCLDEEKSFTSRGLQRNPVFMDALWSTVEEITILRRIRFPEDNLLAESSGVRYRNCDMCLKQLPERLKPADIIEMKNIARRHILRAQKISYTRQHASELLSTQAYLVLCAAVESAYHRSVPSLRPGDIESYWTLNGYARKLSSWIIKTCPDKTLTNSSGLFLDHWFLTLIRNVLWKWSIILTILVHSSILFMVLTNNFPNFDNNPVGLLFLWIIFNQLVAEIITYPWEGSLFSFLWIALDIIVCVMCVAHKLAVVISMSSDVVRILSGLGLLRLIRLLKLVSLVKETIPYVTKCINFFTVQRLLAGYDIGKGFVIGNDDALSMLPRIIKNTAILQALQAELETDRLQVLGDLEKLNDLFPVPVMSLKTRQCAYCVVRRMHTCALELTSAGMLDDAEGSHLMEELRIMRNGLQDNLKAVVPKSAGDVFRDIPWLRNEPNIAKSLLKESAIWSFSPGETVIKRGETSGSLHVVCAGLLRCDYEPDLEHLHELNSLGHLPNLDYPRNMNYRVYQTEYGREGCVLGEIGLLTGRKSDVKVTCLTNAKVSIIPKAALDSVLTPVLRQNIWRTVSVRVAALLLNETPGYEAWTQERIKASLEDGLSPNLTGVKVFVPRQLARCIFLIEGIVGDSDNGLVFVAPMLLPKAIRRLILSSELMAELPPDAPTPQLLVLPSAEVEDLTTKVSDGELSLISDCKRCPIHENSSETSSLHLA